MYKFAYIGLLATPKKDQNKETYAKAHHGKLLKTNEWEKVLEAAQESDTLHMKEWQYNC